MKIIMKLFVLIGLIILMPVILLSYLIVIIEDGFPGIFVQERLGKNKKKFNLYKIRTMYKDTPNLGTHEVKNIQQLKTGYFLRKFKIDELPQLFNYLKGDIALIGPRPGLPNQNKLKLNRERNGVFNIKPGITGLSQVLGYNMSQPEILAKIDQIYIFDKNIKLDVIIFFATFLNYFKKMLLVKFQSKINKLIR